jgi:predicted CoA-binding protein
MGGETGGDAFLLNILSRVKTIAMVGASDKVTRPSHSVFAFLLAQGYHVVGVNPGLAGKTVHGTVFFNSLTDIPEPVDMVDIFRNSVAAAAVVDEALALSPRPMVIWMQLGVCNDEAAKRARALGIDVVMDRCPKIEYQRLRLRRDEHREMLSPGC